MISAIGIYLDFHYEGSIPACRQAGSGQGAGVKFDMPVDPAQLENLKIDGFAPVILQIIPTNLPLFIGAVKPAPEMSISRAENPTP